MSNPWTKEELETYLTERVGQLVLVVESEPILMMKLSLAERFGIAGTAHIFKGPDNVVRAALVGWDPTAT